MINNNLTNCLGSLDYMLQMVSSIKGLLVSTVSNFFGWRTLTSLSTKECCSTIHMSYVPWVLAEWQEVLQNSGLRGESLMPIE
jgi:hypothetical protein